MPRSQIKIQTQEAPTPVGPYSQAIRANGFVFVSGQLPITKDGIIPSDDIEEQMRLCCENLEKVLRSANSSLEEVVKCTIYLRDLAMFSQANEVYGQFFQKSAPSRSCVEVSRLPKDALVEIDCIALVTQNKNSTTDP